MVMQSVSNTVKSDGIHVNKVNTTNTNIDKDLVELAGQHAYLHPKTSNKIKFNGNNYKTLDVNYGSKTCLGVFVIKIVNDNLPIVYVGSEQVKEDRLGTNSNFTLSSPRKTTTIICLQLDFTTKILRTISS